MRPHGLAELPRTGAAGASCVLEHVGSGTARRGVHTVPAVQRVVARILRQHVLIRATQQLVVAEPVEAQAFGG